MTLNNLKKFPRQNNCELRTTVPIACQISKLVQIKVCLILSIHLQSKNKRLKIFVNKKTLGKIYFFFFDKKHAKKMRISLLTRQAVKIDILLTARWTLANLSASIASRPFG